jgi:hypothetical protein
MTVNCPGVGGLLVTIAMDDDSCPLFESDVEPPKVELNEHDKKKVKVVPWGNE